MDNLSGLFDNVNAKVADISGQVGATPQAWNSGIFNMIRSLSENVILPIAATICMTWTHGCFSSGFSRPPVRF